MGLSGELHATAVLPWWKGHVTHWIRGGGPHSRPERCGVKKHLLPRPDIELGCPPSTPSPYRLGYPGSYFFKDTLQFPLHATTWTKRTGMPAQWHSRWISNEITGSCWPKHVACQYVTARISHVSFKPNATMDWLWGLACFQRILHSLRIPPSSCYLQAMHVAQMSPSTCVCIWHCAFIRGASTK